MVQPTQIFTNYIYLKGNERSGKAPTAIYATREFLDNAEANLISGGISKARIRTLFWEGRQLLSPKFSDTLNQPLTTISGPVALLQTNFCYHEVNLLEGIVYDGVALLTNNPEDSDIANFGFFFNQLNQPSSQALEDLVVAATTLTILGSDDAATGIPPPREVLSNLAPSFIARFPDSGPESEFVSKEEYLNRLLYLRQNPLRRSLGYDGREEIRGDVISYEWKILWKGGENDE